MRRVNGIAGAAWAADILIGNKPIPTRQQAQEKGGDGFKEVLDEATRKLQEKARAKV